MDFIVVVPARLDSSRLPGKVLKPIAGKPMVQWVVEQAEKSGAAKVIVATDSEQVVEAVKAFGGEVCLTSDKHRSGTERIGEVIDLYGFSDDQVIVNVQGDEPFIPPQNIAQVAANLIDQVKRKQAGEAVYARMATLAHPIASFDELTNPNAVKTIADVNGYALYFSRAQIPFNRDNASSLPDDQLVKPLRHIGIYALTAGFVKDYNSWPVCALEQVESLEQLRVLYQGEKIHLASAKEKMPVEGVDTPEDLERANKYAQSL